MNHKVINNAPFLLTIAIPTWNRAKYLKRNLDQLKSELENVNADFVEVIVSDNCSPDNTPEIVRDAQNQGMKINYIRNSSNLGWARNFIQCYEKANGKYVLLIGDDDLLYKGALKYILEAISHHDYGVICMRPYGFNNDFIAEHPGGKGCQEVFKDSNKYLLKINRFFTLTSILILNKTLLKDVDSRQFIDTDLATFHLMLRAALSADQNLYVNRFLVAHQRQNSDAYDFSEVFVDQMWRILDSQKEYGLKITTLEKLITLKLFCYYPFYMLDLRIKNTSSLQQTYINFKKRFGNKLLFKYWLAPIILLPRRPAILWGAFTTLIGRIYNGDFYRGIKFVTSRIQERLNFL